MPSASTTSGTQLQQYACGDGTETNQLWTFAVDRRVGQVRREERRHRPVYQQQGRLDGGQNPIVEETCSDIARMQWSFN
ncbi:hypothetical protein M1L60_07945 [Actinoplanes sp. TRM 88003]|uniref:Ricin B lectin domain-containing protein n=1 Tax=Paractinoplanes aksuensis TaxID=2939490 RepID=A0ABT1DI71_9ACTN|nr:hypothetical protein [Actinoplanes aksuensis]MCO8270527.1 hypothetical protein [Actinoplanes aksuensis]